MTKDEFASRVTAVQDKLYRVARGYLRGESDCLDAVSEAILTAWQKRNTLRQEQYFELWLLRILSRECINIQRKQKRMVPVEQIPEESSPPDEWAELRDALDGLPQKLRVVIVLHYLEGYPVADIARLLHVPKGTVTSRLYDGRNRLRDLLKEEVQ